MLTLFIIIIVAGCSSEKEQAIDKLKPNIKDTYNVVIFTENMPSQEFQDSVGDIDVLWEVEEGKVQSFSYQILYEGEERVIDYEAILEIETYPQIVVLDHNGIALQTNKLDKLQSFLENL